MIDARVFAKPLLTERTPKGRSIFFGLGPPDDIAEALRSFADEIERGDVSVEKVQFGSTASRDSFVSWGLFIEYCVAEKPPR